MANIVEENAQLKRDLDTAKKQLTRIGLVHERLGQKSDELAMRYDDERRRSAKRKRTSSVSSVSPSSSRSGSSPSRSHSFGVEQYKDKLTIMNVELDNLKKRLLNKLTNLQDESNTAQAELKIERSKREICEKRRHHIIKMMACLLYQFGADHELLLSFAESCKNEDVTEIEQSQHAVALAEQATRTRREWQQMKAALNEHGTAFEAQRKEADEERDKLLTRLSTLEQESEDRQAALESLKDFRESTEKLRKVLDLTRVTREVDQPAPNNFKNLNAELDKAALSVGVRQLTKSVTNALYVIERNAIQVVTEQANKAYHKLQARLATVEAGVEAEKKRAADAQSALEVCVREKDEALQTAKTLKEAAETAERQKDKYKKVSDAIRLAAQETLRKIEQKPTSHVAPLSAQPSQPANETVVSETAADAFAKNAAKLIALAGRQLNVSKDNVEPHEGSNEDWRLKAEERRVAYEELLNRSNKAIEELQAELKKTKDSLLRAADDAAAESEELRSRTEKLESALALSVKAKNKWFKLSLYFQEKANQASEHGCNGLKEIKTRSISENGSTSESVEL